MKLADLSKHLGQRLRAIPRNLSGDGAQATLTKIEELGLPDSPKDWTVLVYMEGRHRLAHSTDLGLNKLEQVGSTQRMNVVVQATQAPTWQERILPNMAKLPTRRYYIQRDDDPTRVTSPVLQQLPGQVGLNSDSLSDFIAWGMEKFPAKHTMVIIKKHGAGFASVSTGQEVMVPLSARETQEALATAEQRTGKKVNVVAFDSCSMQQMEVAYQLRHHAEIVMGSEEDVKAVVYPYGSAAQVVHELAGQASPTEMSHALVTNYSQRVPSGMQSAVQLNSLEAVAGKIHGFVEQAIGQGVDPSLLYTSMMDTAPMERNETLALNFNFRDLGTFLERVVDDGRYPDSLRQQAREARQTLDNSVVARYSSPDRKKMRQPTGLSTFMPWKSVDPKLKESYNQLEWVKDSGWGRLLDYVLESTPKAAAQVSKGPGQGFGQWGLYQYKKYISPNLNVSCAYTPSCSQFAREAIEQHGLWQGGKMGALRFFSCTGAAHGHDPVPLKGEQPHQCDDHCHHHAPTIEVGPSSDILLHPPTSAPASPLTRKVIGLAKAAGMVAGAVALGAVALPIGAAFGAFAGWKSGTGRIEEHMAGMLERNNLSVVMGFKNIAEPVGTPGLKVHRAVLERTSSSLAASSLGGVAGVISGATLGALGGLVEGARWGRAFGGLWLENRVKEMVGELPQDPRNESILRRDYHRHSSHQAMETA